MTFQEWAGASKLPLKEAIALLYAALEPDTTLDRQAWFLSHASDELPDTIQPKLDGWVARRLQYEPIPYIVGHVDFAGLALHVDNRVLIPRIETEELLQEIERELKDRDNLEIVEIGTGSGALVVALAHWAETYNKNFTMLATDISKDALAVAQMNAKKHLKKAVDFQHGSLLEPILKKVDVIIANLPYIPSHWLTKLDSTVKDYEPEVALDGGEDGFRLIETLLQDAPRVLKPDGSIFLEIWDEHTEAQFKKFSHFTTQIKQDGFGRNRFAVLRSRSL